MSDKIRALIVLFAVVLFCGITLAQEPVQDIDARNHPYLAEAQRLVVQANQKLALAQKANKYDMQGHDERARQLLAEANKEIKAAAMTANAVNSKRKKR